MDDVCEPQVLIAWLDALDWRCTACGYAMLDLAEPVCPECGRPITLDELREELRARHRPQPSDPDPLWRRIRCLGRGRWWCLELIALAVTILAAGLASGEGIDLMIAGASIGVFCHLVLLCVGWWFIAIAVDARLARGKPPPLREGLLSRTFARCKGVVAAITSLCILTALALITVGWING